MRRNGMLTMMLALATAACGGEAEEAAPDLAEAPLDTLAQPAPAAAGEGSATAQLADAQGASVGTATLTDSPEGVRIAVNLTGLPAGEHGIHIHATGRCDAPDFASAGGHFNPDSKQHGLQNPQGPHRGDLPNLTVGADGTAQQELTAPAGTTLADLLDADGAAIVVHATADDQQTDPSGNSGDRIACGVING